MTELFIDGVSAVLPDNFEVLLTSENTLITKSGEYTFDIELSLLNSTNARLYKHFQRLNSSVSFKNRKAILIVDNQVLMNGIEEILSYSNEKAKIQILSGNAELNFVGSEKKVNELDLGKIDHRNVNTPYDCVVPYPESNWTLSPVKFNSEYAENVFTYVRQIGITPNQTLTFHPTSPYGVHQPYLLYYVDKIAEICGFTITENILMTDERAKRIFIGNEIYSTYAWSVELSKYVFDLGYAEILPDWTISEFISEIEKFFNVVYVIDKIKREIKIVRGESFYENSVFYIEDPVDISESTIQQNINIDSYDYSVVEFDFPDLDKFKYMKLADEIINAATLKVFDTFDLLKAECMNTSLHTDKCEIFHISTSDRYYIFEIDSSVAGGFRLIPVNGFRRYGQLIDKSLNLKIIPAPIEKFNVNYTINSSNPAGVGGLWETTTQRYAQVAVFPFDVKGLRFYTTADDSTSMVEIIENGIPSQSKSKDRLYVSINGGIDYLRDDKGQILSEILECSISQNDTYYSDLINAEKLINAKDAPPFASKLTLNLNGQNGLWADYYKNSPIFNQSIQKVFDFPIGKYNPRGLFVIRNREFLCEKLEMKIQKDGFAPIMRGYFYPKD